MKSSMIIGRQQYSLVPLVLLLLCFSLVFLYPSSSKSQETRTTISETTEVESLGGGLEQHTTTTVEDVATENGTVTTGNNALLLNRGFEKSNRTLHWETEGSTNACDTCGPYGGNALQTGDEPTGGTIRQTVDIFDE